MKKEQLEQDQQAQQVLADKQAELDQLVLQVLKVLQGYRVLRPIKVVLDQLVLQVLLVQQASKAVLRIL